MLGLSMSIMSANEVFAMSSQRPAPEIGLNCPAEAPAPGLSPEILCEEMIQALMRAAPDQSVRQLGPDDAFAPGPGRVELTLKLDDVTPLGFAGHLEWQVGDGTLRSGPVLRIAVMDAAVSRQTITRFVDGLLRATPEFIGSLDQDTKN